MSSPVNSLPAPFLDALTEVFNIAFGHAAASLSRLVARRILLSPPRLHMVPPEHTQQALDASLFKSSCVIVHQEFWGLFPGDCAVIIPTEQVGRFLAHLTDDPPPPFNALQPSDLEAMEEVGNILFGALISVLGNMLETSFSFGTPKSELASLTTLLERAPWASRAHHYLIIAYSRFEVADLAVEFVIIIALATDSLQHLVQALDDMVPR